MGAELKTIDIGRGISIVVNARVRKRLHLDNSVQFRRDLSEAERREALERTIKPERMKYNPLLLMEGVRLIDQVGGTKAQQLTGISRYRLYEARRAWYKYKGLPMPERRKAGRNNFVVRYSDEVKRQAIIRAKHFMSIGLNEAESFRQAAREIGANGLRLQSEFRLGLLDASTPPAWIRLLGNRAM